MGAYKQEVETECPYFKSAKSDKGVRGYNITCEGNNAMLNTMYFATREIRDIYTDQYCAKYPNGCWLCKANDKKYE